MKIQERFPTNILTDILSSDAGIQVAILIAVMIVAIGIFIGKFPGIIRSLLRVAENNPRHVDLPYAVATTLILSGMPMGSFEQVVAFVGATLFWAPFASYVRDKSLRPYLLGDIGTFYRNGGVVLVSKVIIAMLFLTVAIHAIQEWKSQIVKRLFGDNVHIPNNLASRLMDALVEQLDFLRRKLLFDAH